jgi:hypothetical protein
MTRMRASGPPGVVRPFQPTMGTTNPEVEKAEALDHIAKALSAIDHNVETLANAAAAIVDLLKKRPR